MLAKTYSFGIQGLDVFKVVIEVDVTNGLPGTTIVGLPDNAIKESRERVRSAIKNSGYDYPLKRITVNLSPADIKKEGPAFDLPIAIGILLASNQIQKINANHFAYAGELSLDGRIRPIRGALALSIGSNNHGIDGLILPDENKEEAALYPESSIYPCRHLKDVLYLISSHADEHKSYQTENISPLNNSLSNSYENFSDVKGQYFAKRGLEIAAAGGHNVLMIGPPGSGKSMLAKRFCGILPKMTMNEMLETTLIQSITQPPTKKTGLIFKRPFRSVHHTTSDVALVGGGTYPKPGEVTLSHNGVLFLDELPEFNRNALEALRQPLEDHVVTISRANKTIQFPSKFQLIAAMNPTRNGSYTSAGHNDYFSRISGPLLDRIDLHIEVHNLPTKDILNKTPGEETSIILMRTQKAHDIQKLRFKNTKTSSNAYMSRKQLQQYCQLEEKEEKLIECAIEELNLSARAYDKIIKISRTIADLDESDKITEDHVAEAIQFRSLDRKYS